MISPEIPDRGRFDGSLHTSDDDSFNDNNSVISNYSENKSVEEGEDNEEYVQEQFEDKLIEMLDGLNQKSSQGRINCIQTLRKALIKKYVPNFVRERHFTICDSIEKSLKKGGGLEKSAAAELAPVISLQLGEEDAGEMVDKTLRPLLITAACDASVGVGARAKVNNFVFRVFQLFNLHTATWNSRMKVHCVELFSHV